MASDAPPSMGGNGDPQPPFISQSHVAIAVSKSNPKALVAHPVHSTASASQVKRIGKRAQDPLAGSEGVQWERLPYLTEKLLSWLLNNPADRAILFNEGKDQDTQGNAAKPHARDLKYGDKYAVNPGKFASAVNTHLTRFKSTGEGISPDDPHHQNLREKVIAEFPFWEQCDLMWHSNPSYDAKLFGAAPGINRTGDFLSIVNNSGCTASSSLQQDKSSEHYNNIPVTEDPGVDEFGTTFDDPNPPHDMTMSEQGQGEEEEEEEPGYGSKDDIMISGGPEDWSAFGEDLEVDHRYWLWSVPDVAIPEEPCFNHFHIQHVIHPNFK
ncbi:hypothetical protein F5141DRAFT_1069122 [Pisolithus sp. B1]|nr:hypothetical protein F5141DRAFT_1069122 [Pisolithus sp. B1]